jgi:hypothetical protein
MSAHLLNPAGYLRRMLWMVFGVSLAGCAFSGVVTYRDLVGRLTTCPAIGAPGTILGVPACVFGLLMFAFLALVSGFALIRTIGETNG